MFSDLKMTQIKDIIVDTDNDIYQRISDLKEKTYEAILASKYINHIKLFEDDKSKYDYIIESKKSSLLFSKIDTFNDFLKDYSTSKNFIYLLNILRMNKPSIFPLNQDKIKLNMFPKCVFNENNISQIMFCFSEKKNDNFIKQFKELNIQSLYFKY